MMEPKVRQVQTPKYWNQVTPLSKYLAMTLFILMPFAGGWVGYTYAPEKVVEIEKIVVVEKDTEQHIQKLKSDINAPDQLASSDAWYEIQTQYRVVKWGGFPSPEIVIEDINVPFREILDGQIKLESRKNYVLEKLTQSEDGKIVLFKSFIPGSSACCGIVKLDLNTLSLTKQDGFAPFVGELPSPGNKFVPNVSGDEITIVDIITNTKFKTAQVSKNETLASSYCGYGGDMYDLNWISSHILEYGVYDKASFEEDICRGRLIEKRRLIID